LKTLLALLALGALAPMLQSALAPYLSAALCPDIGLLLVVALGLSGRSVAGGLLFSGFVGFVADLLSGALLGQHALLRVLAFAAARGANVHVNLVGVGAKGIFVAVLSVLNGLAMGGGHGICRDRHPRAGARRAGQCAGGATGDAGRVICIDSDG
jgi:hypothetical protein